MMADSPGESGVLLICIMTLKAKMQPGTLLPSGTGKQISQQPLG